MLDVDHGTYPYVTSSNSSTAGVWSGSGVPTRHLKRVIGVIKASIQLWPTLVEIAYFHKQRNGLTETLVANQRK